MKTLLSGASLDGSRPRIRDYGGMLSILLSIAILMIAYTGLHAQDQPATASTPQPLISAAEKAFVPARPLNLNQVKQAIGYPSKAVQASLEGVVVASMLVDATGQVIQYTVEGKAHPVLKEAVAAKLFTLKFEPATRGTRPTSGWVQLDFKFSLR